MGLEGTTFWFLNGDEDGDLINGPTILIGEILGVTSLDSLFWRTSVKSAYLFSGDKGENLFGQGGKCTSFWEIGFLLSVLEDEEEELISPVKNHEKENPEVNYFLL